MTGSGSTFRVPSFPKLSQGTPSMPPLTPPRALTSDGNGTPNTVRAGAADLIARILPDTSLLNGLGGKLDLFA